MMGILVRRFNENKPLVSVVIPTYNSEKTLAKCLGSIKNQTYENIEIIVVDKNSRDKTVEIVKSYGIKVFVINARERSEQKNFGVKQSRGKYVYIVDSDFIVEPEVTEEALRRCENENYDAICIHNISDPTISFWSKVRKLERDCYKDDKLNVAARFFKREVFEAIGGFDESLVAGEDYDFHNRLLEKGFRIGRIKAQEIHIGEPKSLWEIAKKYYYYGKTIGEFIKANHQRGIKQLSPIRPAFINHWKEFARHPILTLGFIIYQVVRYFSAGLGYLVGKVRK
jgi:glycosyltransferase involved in cell wall biosynthesis